MLHTITIASRRISGINPNRFVQNGVNADEVTLSVDEEWYDLDQIVITLKNSAIEDPISLIWNKEPVLIPSTLLAEIGSLTVSVAGYRDGIVRVLTEKMTSGLGQVIESGIIGEIVVSPESPDLTEVNARIDEVSNRVDAVSTKLDSVVTKVDELSGVAEKVEVVDQVSQKVDEIVPVVEEVSQKVAVVDEIVPTVEEVKAIAEDAQTKAEQALAGGGSGTRGPSISLGEGRPMTSGLKGDSYIDKSTGQLWEYVEV